MLPNRKNCIYSLDAYSGVQKNRYRYDLKKNEIRASTAKCSGGSPHRERRRRDDDTSTASGFAAALHRTPPPPPPALLRRLGVKEPTGVGKRRAALINFAIVSCLIKRNQLAEPGAGALKSLTRP
ncbi:unnamed protein product, partial [Iphiclides podalirius]